MALSEIKTNTRKQETKAESHTNGSYKISQIIIKIMEYTYIYIHTPISKIKTNNNNKTQHKSYAIGNSHKPMDQT